MSACSMLRSRSSVPRDSTAPPRVRSPSGSGRTSRRSTTISHRRRRFGPRRWTTSLPSSVRFAARRPELNRIIVHEATAESGRLTWMTERHVKPLYNTLRPLWHRLREAGIAAPIEDRFFHYVMVGAASLIYVNAPEARLLTGIEPTAHRWVEIHADGLVAMLLPNARRVRRRRPDPSESIRRSGRTPRFM